MNINYKKLIPTAFEPTKLVEPDGCFTFYCVDIIKKHSYTEYHTGIAIEIPVGYVGILLPVDSVITKDLMMKNSLGVIFNTSRSEIVFNYNDTKQFSLTQTKDTYEIGDCVGQMLVMPLLDVSMIEVAELTPLV